MWLLTGGFFLFGWIFDAFRVRRWIGNYSITFFAERSFNSWTGDMALHIQNGNVVHRIRDALYTAMAPTRQIDPATKADTVATRSCLGQMHNAPGDTATIGYGIGGKGKNHMVVTHDRVLLRRHTPGGCCFCCSSGGIRNEWVSIFLKDLEGVEITKPAQWPTVSVPCSFVICYCPAFSHVHNVCCLHV